VEASLLSGKKNLFIIEEPELNLYPTTQKKLVEYLIEKCTKGDNRLIITTHSPYILTALNNCIEASNVLKTNPDAQAQVDTLVPPASQLDYEDIRAYYVADGTAHSIMHEEYQMIDANALDDVSEDLAQVYDSLLSLKYQPQD
jgi:AAA15 family ATPase/GTPase